jgi:hypothetical protein
LALFEHAAAMEEEDLLYHDARCAAVLLLTTAMTHTPFAPISASPLE